MTTRWLLVALLSSASAAIGGEPSTTPVVGLVAAEDAAISASMAAGARLALSEWERRSGVGLRLELTTPPPAWSDAAAPAVDLAFETRVVALLTPPDRSTAHLLAQLGSRAHLPVVSTSSAPSVTSAGSFWVVGVAPASTPDAAFSTAFRAAEGRAPDTWAVLGYEAAAVVAEAVSRVGLDRRAIAEAWRDGFSVESRAGAIVLDGSGRRLTGNGAD